MGRILSCLFNAKAGFRFESRRGLVIFAYTIVISILLVDIYFGTNKYVFLEAKFL